MSELISVILPVYNVVHYLGKCVESIEEQTYDNIEIILVDDGSSDGSEKLCDELSQMHSNITVVHQENSGASTTRNNGIKTAKGKYVIFCDSDDFIAPDMLEKLAEAKKAFPALLPVCGIKKLSSTGEKDYLIEGEKLCVLEKKDFFIIQKAQLFNAPVNKLFEKEIIEKYGIEFNPCVKLGEDFIFNADYVMKSGCDFAVVNEPLYSYNTFVDGSVSKKYLPDMLNDYIAQDKKFRELIKFTETDMNIYGERYATILLYNIINAIKNTMSPCNSASKAEKINFIKKILNTFDIKDITLKADTSAYSDIYIKMLRAGNAHLIYTFRTIRK